MVVFVFLIISLLIPALKASVPHYAELRVSEESATFLTFFIRTVFVFQLFPSIDIVFIDKVLYQF